MAGGGYDPAALQAQIQDQTSADQHELALIEEAKRRLGANEFVRVAARETVGTPIQTSPPTADVVRRSRNQDFAADQDPRAVPVPGGVLDEVIGGLGNSQDTGSQEIAGAVGKPGLLAGEEQRIKAQAAGEAGAVPVQGADPLAQRQAILAALGGLQPRVIGVTRGGFQPSARSNQAQVESKALPPAWHEALASMTAAGRSAAEGGAVVESELARVQMDAAAKRTQDLQTQARAESEALQTEERARTMAEERIQRAMVDFDKSGYRPENYGTLFAEQSPGGKMAGILGGILGMFGGAATGKGNAFTEQLDKQIERRARAAEAESQRKGALVGMQQNAYARLERSFADSRAARASLRAIYTEQAKEELVREANRVGIAAEHPKLQASLAALEEKRLGYLRETASVVTENARAEERYVPPQAIIAQPTGLGGIEDLLSKGDRESLKDFEGELEKRGVHQAEQGVSLMREGMREMASANPEEGKRFLLRLAAANPQRYGEIFAQFGSEPGAQKFLEGYQRIRQSDAGKALTGTELVSSANVLGAGSDKELDTAVYAFNRRVQDQYDSLRAGGYDKAYKIYSLIRAHNESLGRAPRDLRGVPHPEPQTEGLPVAAPQAP